MEHGVELLLHAHRAAAAMDIPGKGQQFLLGDHGDGLLPHSLGSLLQIKVFRHGDIEYIVIPAGCLGHQRLEHLLHVLSQTGCHRHAVCRAVRRIGVSGIGDLFLLQNPHHIGFFLFFCHVGHLRIQTPARMHRMPAIMLTPIGSPKTSTPANAATTGSKLAIMDALPASTRERPVV